MPYGNLNMAETHLNLPNTMPAFVQRGIEISKLHSHLRPFKTVLNPWNCKHMFKGFKQVPVCQLFHPWSLLELQ